MINKLGKIIKTSHKNLVISESKLYDITKGDFITPFLFDIKESNVNKNIFDVVVRVAIDEENRYYYEYYLYFKINTDGKRVSPFLSSLLKGYINFNPNYTVQELILERKEELESSQKSFTDRVNSFQNNEQYLEEYKEELIRTRKKVEIKES